MELLSKAEYNELIERLAYSVRDEYAPRDYDTGIIETAEGCEMATYNAYHDAVLEHSTNYNALFDMCGEVTIACFTDAVQLKRDMVIQAIIADITEALANLPELEEEE